MHIDCIYYVNTHFYFAINRLTALKVYSYITRICHFVKCLFVFPEKVVSLSCLLISNWKSSWSKNQLRTSRLVKHLFSCWIFRVISRAPGLKLVVETLMSSLKPIGNIVVICCAFFIIFGILGVQVSTKQHNPAEIPSVNHFKMVFWW